MINDPATSEIARSAAVQVVGSAAVGWHAPLMVSEDFSEFQRVVPSCFMLLGSSNPELGLDAAHHNPRFDFDERMLPVGAALLATAATRLPGRTRRLRRRLQGSYLTASMMTRDHFTKE